MALTLTGGQTILFDADWFRALFATGVLLGNRTAFWWLVVVALVLWWLLAAHPLRIEYLCPWRRIAESASMLGLPVNRLRIAIFTMTGALMGLVGMILIARIGNARADGAIGLEFDAIAAAVIGGTRLGGGYGSIPRTMLGVLLIGVLNKRSGHSERRLQHATGDQGRACRGGRADRSMGPRRGGKSMTELVQGKLEQLATGLSFTEGPVWLADHGCLLFTDIPGNAILRWDGADLSTWIGNAHFAIGLTRDRRGRVIACEHSTRSLTALTLDANGMPGRRTVLASSHEGRVLNSTNDVICTSAGTILFTDPPFGVRNLEGGLHGYQQAQEIDGAYVFAVGDEAGAPKPVVTDIYRPNGLCLSPDETRLYVSDSSTTYRKIIEMDFDAGVASTLRDFAVMPKGVPDGMRVDAEGRLLGRGRRRRLCLGRRRDRDCSCTGARDGHERGVRRPGAFGPLYHRHHIPLSHCHDNPERTRLVVRAQILRNTGPRPATTSTRARSASPSPTEGVSCLLPRIADGGGVFRDA